MVSPGGQCIDVGTGLTVPSAWLVTAPFPIQRLNGSYPDPTVVAGPLSTLATYVKSVGNVTNVTMAYKSVVAALGIRTANNGYDIAMCVPLYFLYNSRIQDGNAPLPSFSTVRATVSVKFSCPHETAATTSPCASILEVVLEREPGSGSSI